MARKRNEGGWIKLYRSIQDNEIFSDSLMLHIWIYLLLNANREKTTAHIGGNTIELDEGELIIGRKKLSEQICAQENAVYRRLRRLENAQMIEQKVYSKYTVVKVVNWAFYQDNTKKVNRSCTNKSTKSEQKSEQQSEQISDTEEEYKEINTKVFIEKKEKNAPAPARTREEAPPPPTLEEIRSFCFERGSSVNPVRFYNYNNARRWQGVTDWKLKVEEWEHNEYSSADKAKKERLDTYMSAGGQGEELDLDAFDEAKADYASGSLPAGEFNLAQYFEN